MKEPIGRFGSLIPERARSTASATKLTASSCRPRARAECCQGGEVSRVRLRRGARPNSCPLRHDFGYLLLRYLLAQQLRLSAFGILELLLLGLELGFELVQRAVAELRGEVQVVAAFRILYLMADLLYFLAHIADFRDVLLFSLVLRAQSVRVLLCVGELLLEMFEDVPCSPCPFRASAPLLQFQAA